MRLGVTLHFAQSLDGRIGLGKDLPRALLSGEEGVARAHQARGRHDAVLIGVETLLHDNPLLTARTRTEEQPLRVVLDSALRTPPGARLLAAPEPAGGVLILGCAERADPLRRQALEQAGAEVQLTSASGEARVQLTEAMALLAARGVRSVLVEGGAQVLTAFLRARLATHAEVEVAPVWLGAPATPCMAELGVTSMGSAFRLEHVEVERLGQGFWIRGEVAYPRESA